MIKLLIFLAVVLLLQVLLSKANNKFLGLILPMITFGYSILAIIALVLFAADFSSNILMGCLMILINCNIPTLILLGIYFAFHNKADKKKLNEIEQMSIKDL